MNLLDAIAAAVPPIEPVEPAVRRHRSLRAAPTDNVAAPTAVKPILQFGLVPVALKLESYADAMSNARPNGRLDTLAAFRALVDPLPSFTRLYASSGMSTESLYGDIIKAATSDRDNLFARSMLADAKKQFDFQTFTNMARVPGQWRPVYANPGDWYDLSIQGRFQDLRVDLTDQGGKDGAYAMIGDPAPLGLTINGRMPDRASPDPDTKINSFRMKYLLVSFERPWLKYQLFNTGGWLLSQQPKGYCSSGELQANSGVFPLLPTAMLLGTDVKLDVTWGKKDQALLSAPTGSGTRALGPFSLSAPASAVQLIAWTSSLTPLSPKLSNVPDA